MSDPLSAHRRWIEKFLDEPKQQRKKKMQDFVTSLIRTYAPIVVGAVVSWALTQGITVSPDTQASLIVTFTAVLQGTYYLVVRLLEQRWPKLGALLGKAKAPEYTK